MSGVHTDPRTKIFVLLICAVAITISPSLYYEGGLVLLIFIYGIASGKPKYSVITALVYGMLIGIAILSNLYLKSYSNVKFFRRRKEAFFNQKVDFSLLFCPLTLASNEILGKTASWLSSRH